jgi:hypothetical protein
MKSEALLFKSYIAGFEAMTYITNTAASQTSMEALDTNVERYLLSAEISDGENPHKKRRVDVS